MRYEKATLIDPRACRDRAWLGSWRFGFGSHQKIQKAPFDRSEGGNHRNIVPVHEHGIDMRRVSEYDRGSSKYMALNRREGKVFVLRMCCCRCRATSIFLFKQRHGPHFLASACDPSYKHNIISMKRTSAKVAKTSDRQVDIDPLTVSSPWSS